MTRLDTDLGRLTSALSNNLEDCPTRQWAMCAIMIDRDNKLTRFKLKIQHCELAI